MRISTLFNLEMEGFEIYISGCKGHCKNCHNPEFKDFNAGEDIDVKYLFDRILDLKEAGLIDKIWILGGEPLDNNQDDVIEFLRFLKEFKLPIWLFTRYEYDEIKPEIKELVAYLKCGMYIPYLPPSEYYGVKLASSNQYIVKR